MIGWWIVVAAQTPQQRDSAIDRKEVILATWEAGLGGLDWLQALVDAGKGPRTGRETSLSIQTGSPFALQNKC